MPVIVLEGANGTGTSTQCNHLKEYLEGLGKKVHLTRHPGSTDLGQQLRKILKFGNVETTPQQELLMFAADAMAFYQQYIEPIQDEWIVCDRLNVTGALTYQKAGGASAEQIYAMFDILRAMGWSRTFEYLFIFNAPYSILAKRLESPNLIELDRVEGNKKDRFESRGSSFMENVCSNYENLITDVCSYEHHSFFKTIHFVDASKSIKEVSDFITDRVLI